MTAEIRILTESDADVLANVAPDAFDNAIDPAAAVAFLEDPRHHIAVAIDDGAVVGFVSSVVYVHPDKARPEMWINEVGVAPSHHRQGIARRLMDATLDVARRENCTEAWVLTDRDNTAAMALYASAGGVEAPNDQVMFTYVLDR